MTDRQPTPDNLHCTLRQLRAELTVQAANLRAQNDLAPVKALLGEMQSMLEDVARAAGLDPRQLKLTLSSSLAPSRAPDRQNQALPERDASS